MSAPCACGAQGGLNVGFRALDELCSGVSYGGWSVAPARQADDNMILQFKPRAGARFLPDDLTRRAIERSIVRLAEQHGARETVTVATGLIAVAIETVLANHDPVASAWVEDLKARLDRAFRRDG
jgi:hypothetical protein